MTKRLNEVSPQMSLLEIADKIERDAQSNKKDTVRFSFSGHETFPFRYTWLPKGITYTHQYPDLFLKDDALVILGVGKNMVQSIRHWCETLGLIETRDRGLFEVTELGDAIFGNEGWDPYMEDPGTLWLLHWLLASHPEKASSWYLAFTCWNTDDFTREKLTNWLEKRASQNPGTRATHSSIKRDVDVFLRTYVPARSKGPRPAEDSFDCPLVELGLISEIDSRTFQFVRGFQPSLPDEILIYALLDYWQIDAQNQSSLSFERILHGEGSPGAAFKLSENALVERLERLPSWAGMMYGETAGMRTVLRIGEQPVDLLAVLKKYYS